MKIVVADPGGTTGYAIIEWDGDDEIRPIIVMSGEEPGESFPSLLHSILGRGEIDAVIYERFRIYKGTIGSKATPVIEQIGQIKMVCNLHHVPCHDQPPSKKSFFETKLKALGYYQVAKPHARDAISHGLYFFMSRGYEGRTPAWVLASLDD